MGLDILLILFSNLQSSTEAYKIKGEHPPAFPSHPDPRSLRPPPVRVWCAPLHTLKMHLQMWVCIYIVIYISFSKSPLDTVLQLAFLYLKQLDSGA